MSVTQDYKILTLTTAEWQAVMYALQDRAAELAMMIDHPNNDGDNSKLECALADVQSAYAKVRA